MIKRFALVFAGIFCALTAYAQEGTIIQKYGMQISPSNLQENLSILASDALEGRETGSRGQKMAAAFIRSHFEEIGLAGPVDGGYFQQVPLYRRAIPEAYLKVGESIFTNLDELVYRGFENIGETNIQLIFGGNGDSKITDGLDLKGKGVILFLDEGQANEIVSRVKEMGASLVIICNGDNDEKFKTFSKRIMQGFSNRMSLAQPNQTAEWNSVIHVAPTAIEEIMGKSFQELTVMATNAQRAKQLGKLKPIWASYKLASGMQKINSENVLGYLEGSDKKEEVVVVTAHFDHIGKRDGNTGDVINNGADDDGSGTVAVMELAKVFAKAKAEGHGPRRSMLFMTVTAEEVGLLGSAYYTENPVFPLVSTVVNLNIDMIGRTDPAHQGKPGYVYVIGSDKLSKELHQLNERANATYTQLDMDYLYNDVNHPTNLYKRSDHWNFAKNNIPIVFYFDGIHEDYHRPGDEVSKIEFELLARRTRLVFYTAWEIANREDRIVPD